MNLVKLVKRRRLSNEKISDNIGVKRKEKNGIDFSNRTTLNSTVYPINAANKIQ